MNAARHTLSLSRSAVGVGSWLVPRASWRLFGLGDLTAAGPSAGVMSRLFASRDLAMGAALQHPDPALRRLVLQAGVAVDAVDVVASLVGLRRGAPRGTAVGVTAGALLLAALGVAALHEEP